MGFVWYCIIKKYKNEKQTKEQESQYTFRHARLVSNSNHSALLFHDRMIARVPMGNVWVVLSHLF